MFRQPVYQFQTSFGNSVTLQVLQLIGVIFFFFANNGLYSV